jgi:hypothetical protein
MALLVTKVPSAPSWTSSPTIRIKKKDQSYPLDELIKHHAIRTYGGVEVRSIVLNQGNGWPRADSDITKERKISFPHRDSNPNS